MTRINCKYNYNGAWCTNQNIPRSLFGLGKRLCSEYPPLDRPCPLKEPYPRPIPYSEDET